VRAVRPSPARGSAVRPSREKVDFRVYLRAFGVFARNPTVVIMPLLAGVIGILVGRLANPEGLLGQLTIYAVQLISMFAFGVSIIIADAGWRRGSASFDEAWQDARRKGRDILFAAFGYTFVFSIAQYAAQIIGSIGIILIAIAIYALIFVMAAASIGGVPGGAAISVSIERVRSAPLAAGLLTVVSLVFTSHYFDSLIYQGLNLEPSLVSGLVLTVIQSIFVGYVAIVTAKIYSDVSFTMPRW
jgi:hypothetical protein